MKRTALTIALLASLCGSAWLFATETENLGIRVLPAPGKVAVDGKADDWDLSGGLFACGDVENQREKFGVWFHAMYDAQNLYLLTRWVDETPMNNPGQTIADYGFAGDCLQMRLITANDSPNERCSHWTCWRGVDERDVMDVAYGKRFNEGSLKDAKTKGAQQAFQKNADGPSTGSGQAKGYVQEIAIPWALLTKDVQPLKAGDRFVMTLEPNFTIGTNGRLSIKDIFKPGVTPDRVFTFMANNCWGPATLEPKGKVAPRPERLADAREFAVKMEGGLPVIDWTGLIKQKELLGFKTIAFSLPEDGTVSLIVKNQDGQTVRQLLNAAFFTKGKHEVKWDGLTTANWRTAGEPVPPGSYTWEAIWHKGIGLRLVGWACNAGSAPWDSSPTSNWGGDHGIPVACASDGEKVYLGWSGAEAGKSLLACDLKGNVVWKNSRAGMAGAELVAVDSGVVYAQHWGGDVYRLDAKTGSYSMWVGSDNSADVFVKSLWGDAKDMPEKADAMDARGGKLYLGFTKANLIVILDGQTGKLLKKLDVKAPLDVKARADGQLLVVSEGTTVLALNPENAQATPFLTGLQNARALALDKNGKVYVGLREPDNQVFVFGADGKKLSEIGRAGGRAVQGKWTPAGMAFINGLTVDTEGKLWVMEADMNPKRISVWDTTTGKFVKDFFGPTTYGALGGAINPLDPYLMVGQGCEWRLDPKTGRDACLGVITRDGMENSRFGIPSNGKLYLVVATRWTFDLGDVNIFERVGDGEYRLRNTIYFVDKEGKEIPPPAHGQTGAAAKTAFWADENGDGKRQAQEVTLADGIIRVSGWYMPTSADLTLTSGDKRFPVVGFTSCGAPKYDLAKPVKMPMAGWASTDAQYVVCNGEYGGNNGWNKCVELATGKLRWTYPDNFVGVHGSHNACPAEAGMIRGSFGPCGTVKLPEPIGNAWVIPTNVGEWHILTEDGYYLTRLFEPDPMRVKWPEAAVPGAGLDSVPCGMGGEDFGGSIALAKNGTLYVQAGKTGFWNVEVTGLDSVKAIKGGKLTIADAEAKTAQGFRERYMQEAVGTRRISVAKLTPQFTGNLDTDFKGAEIVSFKKQEDASVRSAAARDAQNLYLAWDVKDKTPWVNSATDPAQMYIGGDTVDFQLGTDPKADKNRNEAVQGDLRLSIGNCQGKETTVLYRKVSSAKKPKTFSSGVVKSYVMEFVDVLADAQIKITKRGDGYVVEAAIPLAALGLAPSDGLALRGDFGATHGDPAGQRTRLRTYWSNQHTGIVDDAVFELQMEPKNWGEIVF